MFNERAVFLTDGEHTIVSEDNEKEQEAVSKLKNLRNLGHEAFALFIGNGTKTSGSFFEIQELFSDSVDGKQNLYFVKSFSQLAELVTMINSTTSRVIDDSQCTLFLFWNR